MASQKFSEVACLLRPFLRSSQNIYEMAASKKPNLANYPFGAASRLQKGGLDSCGLFEAAILYIFWELLRRGLQTSDTQLKCTPWFFVARLLRPPKMPCKVSKMISNSIHRSAIQRPPRTSPRPPKSWRQHGGVQQFTVFVSAQFSIIFACSKPD